MACPSRTRVQWWYHAGIGYQQSGERPSEDFTENSPLTSPQQIIDLALKWMHWGRMRHVSGCDEKWVCYHVQEPFPRWKWSEKDDPTTFPASMVVQCTGGCFEAVCGSTPDCTLLLPEVPEQVAKSSQSDIKDNSKAPRRRYCGMGHWEDDKDDCKIIPVRIELYKVGLVEGYDVPASQNTWPQAAIDVAQERATASEFKHIPECDGTTFLTHRHLHQPFSRSLKIPPTPNPSCAECTTAEAKVQCSECDKQHPVLLCKSCADNIHAPRILKHHVISTLSHAPPTPKSTEKVEAPVLCKSSQVIQCTHGCMRIIAPVCFGVLPWQSESSDDCYGGWRTCAC